MASVDLKFKKTFTPLNPLSVPLAFGTNQDGAAAVSLTVLATLATPTPVFNLGFSRSSSLRVFATLNPLVGAFSIHESSPNQIQVMAALPSPTAAIALQYDVNVIRNLTIDGGVKYQDGTCLSNSRSLTSKQGLKSRTEKVVDWHDAQAVENDSMLNNIDGLSLPETVNLAWQDGINTPTQNDFLLTDLTRHRLSADPFWQNCTHNNVGTLIHFRELLPRPTFKKLAWSESKYLTLIDTFKFAEAVRLQIQRLVCWQIAMQPMRGKETVLIPPLPLYQFSTVLNFCPAYIKPNPLDVVLNFTKTPCVQRYVADRKWYLTVNTLNLKRVADGVEIEITSVDVDTDKSNWCWGFKATIGHSELAKVAPTNDGMVEVELTLNAQKWRFLVESYDQNRSFGKTGINIAGRSVTAYLDAPYASYRSYVQQQAANSVQLVQAELDRADIAFDLSWALVDALGWQVPSGTWDYQNKTPIQAIKDVTDAAGGYLYSHPYLREIGVKSMYPFTKWETPVLDKSIPEAILRGESLKYSQTPEYNGVFLVGDKTGLTAQIRRLGTAGDLLAPQQSHALLTDQAVMRERGRTVLAQTGKQANVTIEMPFMNEVGLVVPRQAVEVRNGTANWWGLVSATSISARRTNTLTTTQTLTVERYYA